MLALGESVDFGKTADDYARHRADFPAGLYERLTKYHGLLEPGTSCQILDLGSGTGTIARHLASAGHRVTALDKSAQMLARCEQIEESTTHPPGYSKITYVPNKTAEDTGISSSASFDLVFAGQCWHWFEPHLALCEVTRLLKPLPSSRLIITHFDWLLLPGSVGKLTNDVLSDLNPAWKSLSNQGSNGTGFYPQWTPQLHAAGYTDVETFSFTESVQYTHDAWCGRIRASAGASPGILTTVETQVLEQRLRVLLKSYNDPMQVPHRCFAIIARPPPVTASKFRG